MISFKDLNYTYPGAESETLHNINFTIAPGEIFGFLGPSGAGKSTTQKILIGLLEGFTGEVNVFGETLKPGPLFYNKLGVGFELPRFYLNLTATENLNFFGSLYSPSRDLTNQITYLLEKVGLGGDATKRVSKYSKGMKTRLNICRALLHDPEVIILDEPTSGLDPVNSRIIRDLIKEQQNLGKTVFLNTHNMEVASELCDRVAFLMDGKIEEINTPEKFMHRYGESRVDVSFGTGEIIETQKFPLTGLDTNPEFLSAIGRKDFKAIHSQEATLEEVFLKVTGRSLK